MCFPIENNISKQTQPAWGVGWNQSIDHTHYIYSRECECLNIALWQVKNSKPRIYQVLGSGSLFDLSFHENSNPGEWIRLTMIYYSFTLVFYKHQTDGWQFSWIQAYSKHMHTSVSRLKTIQVCISFLTNTCWLSICMTCDNENCALFCYHFI